MEQIEGSSGCQPGDLDGDSVIDLADAALLVGFLLTDQGSPGELCAADLNGDGLRDGDDVQPFLDCLLEGNCPPPVGEGEPDPQGRFVLHGAQLDMLSNGLMLQYNRARYYDARHGRWLQRDPSGYVDGANLYEGFSSNPTSYVDPHGRSTKLASGYNNGDEVFYQRGGWPFGYLPTEEEWTAPNIHEDTPGGGLNKPMDFGSGENLTRERKHKTWFYYLARLCNHCSYPACLAACPRNAIYKRPEDGIVLIDQQECRGYRKCVEACPYKKSMYRGTTRTSEKCIACYPRVEGTDPESDGVPMETRCMAACIGQVRMQGLVKVDEENVWIEDRHNPLYYLVHVARVALPLYPQFGTEPNGYYIPPRWVPTKYLEQMFGPGVKDAVERYRKPDRELLAVLQLFRRSNRIISRYELKEGPKVWETTVDGQKFETFNDTIIAYDRKNREIFRTQVEEPIHVRPEIHANSI